MQGRTRKPEDVALLQHLVLLQHRQLLAVALQRGQERARQLVQARGGQRLACGGGREEGRAGAGDAVCMGAQGLKSSRHTGTAARRHSDACTWALTRQHDLAALAGDHHGQQELVGALHHARLAHGAAGRSAGGTRGIRAQSAAVRVEGEEQGGCQRCRQALA